VALMPTPRWADLEITHRCNARCQYCYFYGNEGVVYQDLPTQRWLDFFAELRRARVMYVTLAGGEPLLREDFWQLLQGIVDNRMRFELLTNGWPVTPEVARGLKASGRCCSVEVSLDGSTAEVHESLRGPGSFAPALRAIRLLQEAGLPVTARANVHAQNIEDLPALAHLLLEELGLPSFRTAGVSSIGTASKYRTDIFPSAAQRLQAMRLLAGLEQHYPGRIQASSGPLLQWRMFQAMERARRSGGRDTRRGFLTGCGCVWSRVSVRCDGAYVPCVLLPQLVAGHIGQDALEDVWRSSPVLNAVRARTQVALDSCSECQCCDYSPYCSGSCAAAAWSRLGDVNRPNPEACLRQFLHDLAAEGLALW